MSFELPPTYVAHLVAPFGLNEGCDPHAAGEFGSMVGGLGVRVALEYESGTENGARIKTACGRAFGAQGAVAPLSWLLQRLSGSSWDEACTLTPDDVMNGLCDGDGAARSRLPATVERAAEFAIKAMRRALGIAAHGMPADLEGQGILVCRCIGVGDRRIRDAIAEGAASATDIGRACGAGTGCGSCRPDLLALLEEERPSGPDEDAWRSDEGRPALERIVIARAGPLLRALGLPLESAEVVDGGLCIRTGPARPEALLTPRSAPYVVRQVLRETVGDHIAVTHA